MDDSSGPITCPSCGESLEPSDHFCPSCGTRNERSESPPPGVSRRSNTTTDPWDDSTEQVENGGWEHRDEWGTEETDEWSSDSRRHHDRDRHDETTPGAPGAMDGEESPLRTTGVAVGLGVLGMVLLVVGTILAAIVLSPFGLPETAFLVVGTSVGQLLGFAGLGLWYLRRRGYSWADIKSYLGVRVPTLREVGFIVGGYFAIIGSLIVISIIAALFLPEPAENQGAQAAAENPEIIPAMILMMLLIVGPCEELLYRGVVQNRLRENLPMIPSIVIASAIFAAVHVVALAGDPTGILVTILILFFPGMVFGFIYEYTGNLVVPALLHGIHNSILLTMLFFAPEDIEEAMIVFELIGTLL